jgi:hypothetical protein
LEIDRDHASTMGVTPGKIENALYDAWLAADKRR